MRVITILLIILISFTCGYNHIGIKNEIKHLYYIEYCNNHYQDRMHACPYYSELK